jgi:transcription antitermination factor NusG
MHISASPDTDRPRSAAPWYAIWTRSHCEQLVTDQLAARGFDVFLPRIHTWIRRGGKRRRVDQVLFPGYLFLNHAIDKSSYVEVLKARGVVRVLGDRWDALSEVPHEELESVRRVIASGHRVLGHKPLREGDRVRIIAGPLTNLQGVFVRDRPTKGMLYVSVTLLQRSVAVEVDATMVTPA